MGKKYYKDTSPLAMGKQQTGSSAQKQEQRRKKKQEEKRTEVQKGTQSSSNVQRPVVQRSRQSGKSRQTQQTQTQQRQSTYRSVRSSQRRSTVPQTAEEMQRQRQAAIDQSQQKNRERRFYDKQNEDLRAKSKAKTQQTAEDIRKLKEQEKQSKALDTKEAPSYYGASMKQGKSGKLGKDLAETVEHTLKQSGAAENRMFWESAKGKNKTDPFIRNIASEEEIRKADEKADRKIQKADEKFQKESLALENLKEGHSWLGQRALEATSSGVGMLTDIAWGPASLGHMWVRSTGSSRGQVTKKAEALRGNLEKTGLYSSDELDEMFKNVDAMDMLNAGVSGGIEVLSEKLFAGIGVAKKVSGAGILDKMAAKLMNSAGGRMMSGPLGKILAGTAEEITEEEVGGPLQTYAANLIYGNKFQKMNEDATRRMLQQESDSLLSQIGSPEQAQIIATRLSSDEFLEEAIQSYKESGFTDKESRELAEKSRDYLEASLTGDTDRMEELRDEMVMAMTVGDKDMKEHFGLRDAIDVAASTAIMTAVTGAPSSINTAKVGEAYKNTAGMDAVRNLAEITMNWDADASDKARAIVDRIDSGEDITGTQVAELIEQASTAATEGMQDEDSKWRVAERQMKASDLRVSPAKRTEDGTLVLSENTQQRYNQIVKQTVDRYAGLERIGESEGISTQDVELGADIGAAQMTGVISAEQINELAKPENEGARKVFEEVTGIDLSQYNKYDRNGLLTAETNIAMRKGLMALASSNLVNSARLEQVAWNDDARGEVGEIMSSRMEGRGTEALMGALDKVDPRDRDLFVLTGEAARSVYSYARNTMDDWSEVRRNLAGNFRGVDMDSLKSVFDAARQDKEDAENEYYGKAVKAQESMDRSSLAEGEQAYVPGNFTNESERALKGSEIETLSSVANELGINVVMTDELDRNENGRYIYKTRTVMLNSANTMGENLQYIFSHEVTHHLAVFAPDEYIKLSRFVMDRWYKENPEEYTKSVGRIQKLYKEKKNQDLSPEQALEELIADSTVSFWQDERFVRDITQAEPTLAQKIINSIKDILRKLRNLLASGRVTDEDAREGLLEQIDGYETAYSLWMNAYNTARKVQSQETIDEWQEKANKQSDTDIRHSLSDEDYMAAVEALPSEEEDYFGRMKGLRKIQKMVDEAAIENGYSIKAYHGTDSEPFNVFDRDKLRHGRQYGDGFYFSPYEEVAGQYGNEIREYYLKANGMTVDEFYPASDRIAAQEYEDFDNIEDAEMFFSHKLQQFEENGQGIERFRPEARRVNGKYRVTYTTVGSFQNNVILVATEPEYIKSAEPITYDDEGNVIPLSQRFNPKTDDTRFSLSEPVERVGDLIAVHNLKPMDIVRTFELGGFPMPSIAVTKDSMGHDMYGDITLMFHSDTIDPKANRANEVYGGDAWTPTFPAVKKLYSQKKAKEIAGKLKDILGIENEYKDLPKGIRFPDFDQENLSNKLDYTTPGEAYTHGSGSEVMKLAYLKNAKNFDVAIPMKEGSIRNLDRQALEYLDDKLPKLTYDDIFDTVQRTMEYEPAVREARKAYYESKGNPKLLKALAKDLDSEMGYSEVHSRLEALIKYRTEGMPQVIDDPTFQKVLSDNINEEEYKAWVDDLYEGIVEKEGIRNEKDLFMSNGNRRSWSSLHDPVTLDNVVRVMRKELAAGSNGLFGANPVGAAQKKYGSLNEIRADEDRLQQLPEKEYEALKDAATEEFTEVCSRIVEANPKHFENRFGALLSTGEYIAEILNSTRDKNKIQKKLKADYWLDVSDETMDDLMAAIDKMASVPTGYFEAKPRRAVGIDEVRAAIIPSDQSLFDGRYEEIRKGFEDYGVPIYEYDHAKEGDRTRVVNEAATEQDLRFSISEDSTGRGLSEDQRRFFNNSKVVDSEGRLKVMYHGSPDIGFTVFNYAKTKPGTLGRGFYFTDTASHAGTYGEPIKVYLNIENPLTADTHDITRAQLRRFVERLAADEDYGIDNYGYGSTVDSVTESVWGGTDFQMLHDLNLSCVGDLAEACRLFNEVNGTNYDGIITPVETLAMRPEQIKLTDNLEPTSDPDIRYSLDEDYMAAVNARPIDKQAAAKLVEIAAVDAGYNIRAYHGTGADFTVFDINKSGRNHGGYSMFGTGFYFSDSEDVANYWGHDRGMINAFIRLDKPFDASGIISEGPLFDEYTKLRRTWFPGLAPRTEEDAVLVMETLNEHLGKDFTTKLLMEHGYDGVVYRHPVSSSVKSGTTEYVVFKPGNVKSAETIEYAEPADPTHNWTIIPLSQRFDPYNDDIRYSLPTQDSNGRVLSDGQMEYFKNSQARDEQGRLAVVYHSTTNGGFTIFDPAYSDDKRSIFFTDNYTMSQSYSGGGEEFKPAEFGLPEPYEVKTVDDLREWFTSLNGSQAEAITVFIYGDDDITYSDFSNWGSYDSLADFVERYGSDYEAARGQFCDIDGLIVGEFNTTAEMAAELQEAVKEINRGMGGTQATGERGTYACYLNLQDPLIIDCKGANWDSIMQDGFETMFVSSDIEGETIYIDGTSIPWTLDEIRSQYGVGFAESIENWLDYATEEDRLTGDNVYTWYGGPFDPQEEGYPMEGNTRFWCQEAEAMDYDGVIFRNLQDYGHYSRGYGSTGDVYVAFSSEQVKDINNQDPTNSPDIRYSIVNEDDALEWLASQYDLDDVPVSDAEVEEGRVRMAKSKEEFVRTKNTLWNERWLTEGKILDVESVKKSIREVVMGAMANSDTKAKYKSELVDKTLITAKSAFWLMKSGKHEEAAVLLWDAAYDMIQDVDFIEDTAFKEYKGLRDFLRTTPDRLAEEYWSDVDYNAFRKRNMGRIRLVKGDNNVDQILDELMEIAPEWFSESAFEKNGLKQESVPDILLQMEAVLDAIQPYRIAYSSEEAEELAGYIADDLYDIVYEGKEYKSVADTYKQRYDAKTKALKQRHEEALAKVKEQMNRNVAREKAKFKEYKEKQKSAKEHAKHFGSIAKNIDWLTDRLLNETKDKNIPEGFRRSLAHLLMQFDMQTERSKKLEAKYGPAQKTLRMRELKDRLDKIAKDDDTGEFRYDGYLFYLMDALAEKVDGKTIDALDTEDLIVIDTMLKSIRHNFSNYNKIRIEEERVAIANIGDNTIRMMRDRIEKYGQRAAYRSGVLAMMDKLVNEGEESPIYFFERLDPDGQGIGAMYKELRRGEDTHIRNIDFLRQRFKQMFGEYFNEKNPGSDTLESWRDDSQSQTFNLKNGTITLNPAQIMSLYCLSKRTQAMGHILGAGIVASPVTFGAKMKDGIKAVHEQVESVMITHDEVLEIISKLTPEQVKLADEMQSLLNNEMAAWGNETSLEMHGIKLFREKDYFPIKSSGESLAKTADSFEAQEKIKNFGFTKPLVKNANNAIMIDDIFSVVADHCNKMALYNAMAIPISDFMRVYNYKQTGEDGSQTTVQQMIGQAFTRKANAYIMKFIGDVNGNTKTKSDAVDDLVNKALANYKKASIGLNARVALQQPTAIFRSLMVLNPKYFKGVKVSRKEMAEMFEHCPIALWKSWGHYDMDMGRDIEDIMMNNDWSKWDAISMGIYGELDNLTWSIIWQAVKNEVRATHPDVKEGSPEWWDLCNERASNVYDKTQVVDSIFHRSDTMRSKNTLTKMLTSFMAEPTLTYNVFRDSIAKARDMIKDGNTKGASELISKMIIVLVLNAAAVSASAALWDAVRGKSDDDDDDTRFAHLWLVNFMNNFGDNINIINNIYFAKDIWSLKDGWGTSNMALEGWETLFKGLSQAKKKITEGSKKTWYEILMNAFGGVGYITGVPVKTMMRDLKAIAEKLGIDVFAADSIDEVETKKADGIVQKIFGKDKKEEESDEDAGGVPSREDLPDNLTEEQKDDIIKSAEKRSKKAAEKGAQGQLNYDDMLYKALKAASGLEGEEYNKKIYSSVANGLKGYIADGDYMSIGMMRTVIEEAGGDVDYFDSRVLEESKTAFKKSLGYDLTHEQRWAMKSQWRYMVAHGMTEEQISADIIYKSDLAKDMKVAYRLGDNGTIYQAMVPLVDAGIMESDLQRLYENRNRMDLAKYDGRYKDKLKSTGNFIWPTEGVITSGFGRRSAPTRGASSFHSAIDIGAPQGTPVVAADGGEVIEAGKNGGYGNSVGIRHDDGTISYYNHLYAWNVKVGDTVAQGQQIGQVGSTGISTGPHLDFRLYKDGEYLNPEKYLNKRS